jgi:hypothetical protein
VARGWGSFALEAARTAAYLASFGLIAYFGMKAVVKIEATQIVGCIQRPRPGFQGLIRGARESLDAPGCPPRRIGCHHFDQIKNVGCLSRKCVAGLPFLTRRTFSVAVLKST